MKKYSRITCIILTIIMLLGIGLCNNTQADAEEITVYPENMLCVRIVDENGNIVSGVSATLVDPSGTEIAKWDSDDLEVTTLNKSTITARAYFNEPISTFEKLVAPGILQKVTMGTNIAGINNVFSSTIPIKENDIKENVDVAYIPASLECDLTVPANTYMVYADSKWASACGNLYVSVDGVETSITGNAGTLTKFSATPSQTVKAGCRVNNGMALNYSMAVSTSSTATEYDKVRTKLYILRNSYVNGYGEMKADGKNYVKVASGDIAGGEGLIICVSGSVITYPVLDENGFVDIYVDKATGQYQFYRVSYWTGGVLCPYETTETLQMVASYDVKTCEYPDNCTFMGNLAAGNYTIKLENIPEQYIQQSSVSVTVKDSSEFQMLDIVLKKPHVHSYGSDYKYDASNHWNECSCGDKSGVAAHTPGPEATTDSPQVCTVCGYVIKPALGHTHSFEGDYKSDASNHWKVCSCGVKGQMAAHIPGPEATEDTDQVCTVCGRILKPALNHIHSYDSEYKSNKDSHWKECACGAKGEEAAHVPGPEATEDTDQICTVCGRILKPSLNHVHEFSVEYFMDENNHWKECLCGEKDGEEAHSFEWVVEKEATEDEPGLKHEECTICHYQKASVEILAEEETEEKTTKTETTSSKKQEETDTTTVKETEKETEEKEKGTGKKSNCKWWIWLLILLILIIIIIIIILKKKDEEEEEVEEEVEETTQEE